MESSNTSEIWSAPSLDETPRSGLLKHEKQNSRPEPENLNLTDRCRAHWDSASRLSDDWWLQELLAWTTSLGVIAAIFGILMTYHERPLPDWPYIITINTVLSLLAVVAKGCLLVPVISSLGQLRWIWLAERHQQLDSLGSFGGSGPGFWSSLQLLYTLRGKWLGCLGVVLTILIASLEPFTQQAVTYPSRQVGSGSAYVPLINSFGLRSESGHSDQWGAIYSEDLTDSFRLTSAMLDSLANGFQGGPDRLSYNCPSGDCTFPIFLSLGICSACEDLTHLVTHTCVEDENGNSIECTWTLPSDQISVRVLNETIDGGNAYKAETNITVMSPLRSTYFKEVGSYIIAFSVASASCDPNPSIGYFIAEECVLFWCVQTYYASVTQNIKFEEVISYIYNHTNNAPNIFPGEPVSPVNGSSNNTLAGIDYELIQIIPTDVSDSVFNADGPFIVDAMTNFTISTALSDWLQPSSWSNLNNITTVQSGSNLTGCLSFFIKSHISTPTLSDESREDTTIVRVMMSNIASSMTDSMRALGGFNSFGTSWTSETYIHVRWEWLLFPVLFTCLALFFLVAVIINTTRSKTRIWKSDPLALIFHGLDFSTQIETGEKEKLSEMKEAAKTLSVKLVQTSSGSKLSTDSTSLSIISSHQ